MSDLLKSAAMAAGGIEWRWWSSNSVLRLTSNHNRGLRDGDVLSAIKSIDGTPLLAIDKPYRDFIEAATPAAILALVAENERLRGLKPALPPRPPDGFGLPRYGLRWNGPGLPLAVQMDDGYWTPWHLAEQAALGAEAR
ncbi:hypothetical protein PSH87_14335 [Pseudomonas sp. FP453]|uniref:hypothetical protein n=1 Tax=Pseudomonas sp. FP453 TaxID=2954094 RepID=UPI0027365FE0|nr:hypothetical protein [Pseudomonas sp. FP453]WLH87871.1 hypothetical protein PSH87_14335 [Pseudomonas sp. FP453]